ncbi:peptidase S41, partial [Ulvibacter sp.]|nr:peptidase S41 [Ulvibacter sp.]
KRYRNGELLTADSIQVADSLRFFTPLGNVVYGGGGIIPDIFVPKDTSIANETLEFVSRSGFMNHFIFEYLEKNRSWYKNLTVEEFIRDYVVEDSLPLDFIKYARLNEAGVNLSEHSKALKKALKAAIGQQIFGPNVFEFILNEGDPMLLKVIELESQPIDD